VWQFDLLKNLFKGPSTEAFPFGEATTPEAYRGRVTFDATACTGCRTCQYVCAAGAIHFEERQDGLRFTLWHNSCVFCGMCESYCVSKAVHLTNDWHLAHLQSEKYEQIEEGWVPFKPCTSCHKMILPVAMPLMRQAFRGDSEDIEALRGLCTECRQTRAARRIA
jgi:formate hydrogenlyase subunit 6/NADH:ubiquinone oxidoreductase subunit I